MTQGFRVKTAKCSQHICLPIPGDLSTKKTRPNIEE